MTLLVISDSHGKIDRIERAVALNPTCEAILFLGDCLRDLERAELNSQEVISVRGNCDVSSYICEPEERMVRFGEYNIMLMHGHRFDVKGGDGAAVAYAAKKGADVLLYGHTHMRLERYFSEGERVGDIVLEKPLAVFNPGRIGEPRGDRASFGVVVIRGKDILISHGEL